MHFYVCVTRNLKLEQFEFRSSWTWLRIIGASNHIATLRSNLQCNINAFCHLFACMVPNMFRGHFCGIIFVGKNKLWIWMEFWTEKQQHPQHWHIYWRNVIFKEISSNSNSNELNEKPEEKSKLIFICCVWFVVEEKKNCRFI